MENNTDTEYVCPNSNGQRFRGQCSIITCPANISHIPNRPSGCFHIFLENRPDNGKYEIAYAFGTSHRAVEDKIAEGKQKIKRLMVFSKILTRIKNNRVAKNSCSKCGVARTTAGDCINTIQCNGRSKVINKMLGSYPYNLPDFNITARDIYSLAEHKTRLQQYVAALHDQLTLRDVLELKPKAYEAFLNLKTEV